jgi:hypothetical protein
MILKKPQDFLTGDLKMNPLHDLERGNGAGKLCRPGIAEPGQSLSGFLE